MQSFIMVLQFRGPLWSSPGGTEARRLVVQQFGVSESQIRQIEREGLD
jgi:hypothetical protein